MSLPCPERDALESIEQHTAPWPIKEVKQLTPKKTFRLTTGAEIFFFGVSNGAGMRKNPNLHLAVFGTQAPENIPTTNAHLLPQCRSGGLITGPDNEGWHWAEGLEIISVGRNTVRFFLTGQRAMFRPI